MLGQLFMIAIAVVHESLGAPNCNVKDFDAGAQHLIVFNKAAYLPKTAAELSEYCKAERESLSTTTEYNDRCVSGLGNGMMKILLEGASNEIGKHCTKSAQENVLKITNGLDQAALDSLFKCTNTFGAAMEAIMTKPSKNRIPLVCCQMNMYADCVTKRAQKVGPDHKKFFEDIIHTYAGDLLDTVCSKFDASSKGCKNQPAISPVTKRKFKTLVPPLSVILASV